MGVLLTSRYPVSIPRLLTSVFSSTGSIEKNTNDGLPTQYLKIIICLDSMDFIMLIKEIKIHNILSYRDCTFSLKQSNVILGPNNSGKTNMLRILDMMKKATDIEHVELAPELRSGYGHSLLSVIFLLTRVESRMLEQLMFQDSLVDWKQTRSFSQIQLVVVWNDGGVHPTEVILRFSNGITVLKNKDSYCVFYTDKVSTDGNPTKVPPMMPERKSRTVIRTNWGKLAPEKLFSKDGYRIAVHEKNLKKYFTLNKKNYCIPCNLQLKSYIGTMAYDYLGVPKTDLHTISIFFLIAGFFKNGISITGEMRPTIKEVADLLFDLKIKKEFDYEEIKSGFSKIFAGVKLKIRTDESSNNQIIVHENKKAVSIDMSSSGYFEALYILYQIHGKKGQSVFFDEIETHLHPNLVRKMAEYIDDYGKDHNDDLRNLAYRHPDDGHWWVRENQISIITHSPALVSRSLLRGGSRSLLYVRRGKYGYSTIHTGSDSFKMKINPNQFNPNIFFERCVVLVEGPSDEYAMKGLSDRHDDKFGENGIIIVNTGGNRTIPHYVSLLKEYGIPYVAMADSDYVGKNEEEEHSVFILDSDLESELKSYGWRGRTRKIHADDAYEFTHEVADKQSMENSTLYQVMEKAVSVAGGTTAPSTDLQSRQ